MAEKNKKNSKDKVTVESYKNKIVTYLNTGKRLIPLNELETKCRTKKSGRENFVQAFTELRDEGIVTVRKGMKVALCSRMGFKAAEITRLSRTFGFAVTEDGTEYFIPGKCMMGAMPRDRVLITDIPSRSGEPEGEVIDILSFGSSTLTGVIEYAEGALYLVPDIASRNHMIISKGESVPFVEGDKVLAEIVYRGRRHAEHKVKIVSVFGSAELAASCAESIITASGIITEFSDESCGNSEKYDCCLGRRTCHLRRYSCRTAYRIYFCEKTENQIPEAV